MFKKLTYSIVFICLTASFSFSQNPTVHQQAGVQKTAPPAASSINAASNVNLIEGKVVYIYDGDTISVQTPDKLIYFIRLQGIDAPENKQNYGKKAKKSLEELLEGKDIKVVIHKKDLYDRFISSVYIDGKDVSLMQIAAGMAWHYKQYSSDQTPETRKRYALAEQRARDEKKGLWEDDKPTPPWDHKNGKTGDTAEKNVNASANSAPARTTNNAAANAPTKTATTVTTPAQPKTPPATTGAATTTEPKQTGATESAEKKSNDASDEKKYVRGPRGGCYYINKSGSKTYVDRNLCQE